MRIITYVLDGLEHYCSQQRNKYKKAFQFISSHLNYVKSWKVTFTNRTLLPPKPGSLASIYIVYIEFFLYNTRSYLHKKSLVSGLGAMCFINNDILLWLLWRSAPLHFRDAETSGSTYGYLNTFPSLNGYSPFYIT